ncbi:hypothetical protein ACVWXM_007852 [Bradyrhizobium sp. GM7.3]
MAIPSDLIISSSLEAPNRPAGAAERWTRLSQVDARACKRIEIDQSDFREFHAAIAAHSRSRRRLRTMTADFPVPSWDKRVKWPDSGKMRREGAKLWSQLEMRAGKVALPPHAPSLRAQRSNPVCRRGGILDCFAALAMTMWREGAPHSLLWTHRYSAVHCRAATRARQGPRRVSSPFTTSGAIASHALEANCRRQVTITTVAVVTNNTQGLTNQPR